MREYGFARKSGCGSCSGGNIKFYKDDFVVVWRKGTTYFKMFRGITHFTKDWESLTTLEEKLKLYVVLEERKIQNSQITNR